MKKLVKWIILSLVLLLVVFAAAAFLLAREWGLIPRGIEPDDAAAKLGIQIPTSATEVHASHDDWQGTCTSVEFLLPNDQWRRFVESNHPVPVQPSASSGGYTCGPSKVSCEGDAAPLDLNAALRAFEIRSTGDDGVETSIHVTPNCRPGSTRVTWWRASI
ncbi:hypothetical protein GOARA_068_00550 [Gordonia araii NBRC 100433]|uniref:Uncharacterized protein n=1 Tax=Gordonia araii NBRC 100433 TaxID=1073574 RepID=G7H6C1_9ACTN|nr:hypothetical protein [Gordonia araii]NNG96077.1 hypothetical protein [Gordonia araii NBRC 100433]GAB11396.1 hypothetical protein GOARA_068_00550 [Gordonia araii NBRC 100433]